MPATGGEFVLGYDFGTSSVKAALFDAAGGMAASASASYPLLLPELGWAEQRPEDWWSAMCSVTRQLLATSGIAPARVAAIGICGQMCGVVPVDRSGTALGNGIIWLDMRSSEIARHLVRGWIRVGGYGLTNLLYWLRLTGGAPNPSGKDPPSKMLWLRRHRPELWQKVHKLLDVKDYIVQRCTGHFVTSFDCAHLTWLFDARAGHKQWLPALLGRVGLEQSLLPDIVASTDAAGGLGEAAAAELGLKAGTLVSAGLGDVSAAALAAGTPGHHAPHLCVGTSDWLGATLPASKVNPLTGIGSVCAADGKDYLLIAAQENAGACVNWALGALGFEAGAYDRFDALAGEARAGRASPLFQPWLYGERVPIDDKNVRGGFLNVSVDHTRGDLARAVYEGVALNVRSAMGDFDRLARCAGKPLRMVGGGGNSALWCQIFADVLQRPIEVMETPALGGARGSAMTAAVTAGWYGDLAAAAVMTHSARSFLPDAGLGDFYAERFALFTAGYRRVRPWYGRLARTRGPARGIG